jgi:hypothetical protein
MGAFTPGFVDEITVVRFTMASYTMVAYIHGLVKTPPGVRPDGYSI